MSNGVFISYRREGGDATAQLINERLLQAGYSVFYDIESSIPGHFDETLYRKIEECEDFVLILSIGVFDKCRNKKEEEKDWVRKEFLHAVRCKKNIIPVAVNGFEFNYPLPDGMTDLPKLERIELQMKHLESCIDGLISMLRSTPDNFILERRPSLIKGADAFASPKVGYFHENEIQYTSKFDRDKDTVINFHVRLAPINNLSNIRGTMLIYNSDNTVVHSESSLFSWPANNNLIMFTWKIKQRNMPSVALGKYRAEFWVENSEIFKFSFEIFSSSIASVESFISSELKEEQINRPLTEVEKKLSRPKGFSTNIGYNISWFFFIATVFNPNPLTLIMLAIHAFFFLKMYRYTKDYVCKKTFLAVLLVMFGGIFYSIYLMVGSFNCFLNYNKLKKKQEECANLFDDLDSKDGK